MLVTGVFQAIAFGIGVDGMQVAVFAGGHGPMAAASGIH